ncbi:hypothetical protein EDD11_007186 [Mortierella claussenii]|nr:hypothetical protein EDD11_007186 [Mortierella claussenii]
MNHHRQDSESERVTRLKGEQACIIPQEDIVVATPPNARPKAVSGAPPSLKRARVSTRRIHGLPSVHKPFRSPVRLSSDGGSSDRMALTQSFGTRRSADSTENTTETVTTKVPTPGSQDTQRAQGHVNLRSDTALPGPHKQLLSNTQRPLQRTRRLFRSPVAPCLVGGQPPSDTPYGRLIQIQTLKNKITELQSSIRKARQVVHQQQTNDKPLQDLIDKWRRASQAGAQVLLEKFVQQEQFFGGGDKSWNEDHFGSSSGSVGLGRGHRSGTSEKWDWDEATLSTAANSYHGLVGMDREMMDAVEGQMETQDVQDDLPTVEEAIRSRISCDMNMMYDETAPRTMTAMWKLLISLGVDPAIIGYDVEQDAFINDALPRESW